MKGITASDWLTDTRKANIQSAIARLRTVANALLRDRLALLSLAIIATFTLIAIFGPSISPYRPDAYQTAADGSSLRLHPPTLSHPFGTTHLGQDVFAQWIYGTRTTLLVGLVSGLAVMFVGTNVGLIAGYYKGRVDNVLMRIVDVLYGLPGLPLVLILALFLGPSIWNITFAMALVLWRTMARIIRAQTLSLSERPFVKAAKATGASDARIIYRHILPNVLPVVFIETVIMVSTAIILEASASFLGAGAVNTTSWGTMLQMTFVSGAIRTAWWWVLPPGIGIVLVVMSLFYISRAFEEITNPEVSRFD